jgi:phosphonate transport system ATP-binding protein
LLDPTFRPRASEASPGATEPVLSVRALSKAFARGPHVLSDVNLDIKPGEAVALIGANGTGKSTLIRCLVRLVEPTGGHIRLFGLEVRNLRAGSLRRLRSRVGFVFQRHNLVLRLSVLSNVIHGVQARMSGAGAWYQGLAPNHVRAEAVAALDRVGLAEKTNMRADALSGGQSQRVAIARMLMQRPDFVIADEPDASLDPKSGEEVMKLLRETASERGLGLIFVSHDLEHAVQFSDRIVGLADGRVALDVTSCGVKAEALQSFFVGTSER